MKPRRLIPLFFLASVAGLMTIVVANRIGLIELPHKYDPLGFPDLAETPHWLTSTQLKRLDVDPVTCTVALQKVGLNVGLLPSKGLGTSCERRETVNLDRLSHASLRPEQTRCNIAARLYEWERHVVQPEARRAFGQPVAEVLHFGSYSCRTIARSSYMSEHATANAFDIAGFRLQDGSIVSVRKDWSGKGRASVFLHQIRNGACDYFNLTLSPDYNADHQDHFHVDMGWLRGCH